jgi:hypothetical protein
MLPISFPKRISDFFEEEIIPTPVLKINKYY